MEEQKKLIVDDETGEVKPEPKYVEGLFCFHAISADRSQRFCTYRQYPPNTDPDLVAQDARDWFRIQMRISEVNEKFSLLVTFVC